MFESPEEFVKEMGIAIGLLAALFVTVQLVWAICILIYEWVILLRQRSTVSKDREYRAERLRLFKARVAPGKLREDVLFNGDKTSEESVKEAMENILELEFEELRESLQSGKFNAYTVMCAYVWRALDINFHLKCITEVISEAFDDAAQLDSDVTTPKGPLFGVPFSVKSNFYVKNYKATNGLARYLDLPPADHTCGLVEFLKSQGAVPFCLTNVPQGLLSYVTANPLYGTTKNPWDFKRTSGGSSGGEAALVAAGGAPFGIGNDLVGSLRIPAAFCGLVSLKPTQQRLFEDSMNPGFEGRGRLGMSSGFFTRNVKDQKFLLKLTIGHPKFSELNPCTSKDRMEDIEPTRERRNNVPDVRVQNVNEEEQSRHSEEVEGDEGAGGSPPKRDAPNDSPEQQRPESITYKIGVLADDEFMPVAPSNKRAVEEAGANLYAIGHTTAPFDFSKVKDPFKAANMLFRNVMPDNGAYMSSQYSGEEYEDNMSRFIRLVRYKQNILFEWLLNYVLLNISWLTRRYHSKRLECLSHAHNSGASGVRMNQEKTDKFKKDWIKYWKEEGFHALICPSFITPAQPFKYPAQLSTGVFITGLFNMLDCPAGIVPVPSVGKKENDSYDDQGDYLLRLQKEALVDTCDLPNAVQIVTLPNQEELCLEIMRLVEDAYSSRAPDRLKFKHTDKKPDVCDSHDCFERVKQKSYLEK